MAGNDIITIGTGKVFRILLIVSGNGPALSLPEKAGEFEVVQGESFSRNMVLKDNASADIVAFVFPGAGSSLDFRIGLEGEGAQCRLSGIYLCPDAEKVDIRVNLEHKVPHCFSSQLFKGIVSGTARAGFYGRITVAYDAQKTEAYQANHSLLLSDTARVDTQPQLEIYADDVKCSHGATVGKLNAEEQFYMRSRGIPEQEAKVLQMLSFLSPVLDTLPESGVRENLADYVEQTVRRCF